MTEPFSDDSMALESAYSYLAAPPNASDLVSNLQKVPGPHNVLPPPPDAVEFQSFMRNVPPPYKSQSTTYPDDVNLSSLSHGQITNLAKSQERRSNRAKAEHSQEQRDLDYLRNKVNELSRENTELTAYTTEVEEKWRGACDRVRYLEIEKGRLTYDRDQVAHKNTELWKSCNDLQECLSAYIRASESLNSARTAPVPDCPDFSHLPPPPCVVPNFMIPAERRPRSSVDLSTTASEIHT